ncbi:TPR repeat [Prosthecobacter debontii]|uniref:TPR repeat n=1 Tax=Prosthecobacter debontii TaxID=48467 RepID=A0A1T4Z3W3_9BACT|nr:tetratricopeptide repeat protein [Prosthecobacter debontii]SKB08720.1 TPR repeat [Prosthecobacter debontii]
MKPDLPTGANAMTRLGIPVQEAFETQVADFQRQARKAALRGPGTTLSLGRRCCSPFLGGGRGAFLRRTSGLVMAWHPLATILPLKKAVFFPRKRHGRNEMDLYDLGMILLTPARVWLLWIWLAVLGLSGVAWAQKAETGTERRTSAAAERVYQIGLAQAMPEDGPQDLKAAVVPFKQAAVLGHAKAAFLLAQFYFEGEVVPKDEVEGMRLLRASAARGHGDALMDLAERLYHAGGSGDAEMLSCATQVAERGHAKAQYLLGTLHDEGRVVKKDPAAALQWFLKAAALGFRKAQFNAGVHYALGKGAAKDEAEAAWWYRQAAEQGDELAQYNLGVFFSKGRGVAQDAAKAARWYTRAAEQGMPEAARNLSILHFTGRGVAKDLGKACLWLLIADRMGSPTAAAEVKELEAAGLTRSQRVEAERLAAEFTPVKEPDPFKAPVLEAAPASSAAPEPAPADLAEARRQATAFVPVPEKAEGPAQGGMTEEEVELVRKAAEGGHAEAQVKMSRLYQSGHRVPKDNAQAAKWARKAAEQGHADGQHNLALAYFFGYGVPQDAALAVQWEQKAAVQGLVAAQYSLGLHYRNGLGVSKDAEAAARWLRKAAEQGHVDAQLMLAIHSTDALQPADLLSACRWALIARANGSTRALRLLEFLEPALSPAQMAEARSQADAFVPVPEKADAPAAHPAQSPSSADSPPLTEQIKSLRRDAGRGNAEAQWTLAERYRTGDGVAKDPAAAARWMRRAAEQGHARATPMLGHLYFTGEGVEADPVEAMKWMLRAAEWGDANAQCVVARAYGRGRGVKQDPAAQYQWHLKAAAHGHPEAQYGLGVSLILGDGVPKDEEAAAAWFLKAANQGHAEAQMNLGSLYGHGQGVPLDYMQAYRWMLIAAAQGTEGAAPHAKTIESVLTPAEKAEGKRLADTFVPVREK